LFESLAQHPDVAGRPPTAKPSPTDPLLGASPADLVEALGRFLRFGELASLAALIEGVTVLQLALGGPIETVSPIVLRFLDALGTSARSQLERISERDHEVRRLWTIIDLTLATLLGMVRFGLLTDSRGFDAIDEYDCREWLMLNGASRQSCDSGYM